MKFGSGATRAGSSQAALARRLSQAVVAIALVAGILIRTIALDAVPPGLHHDEAVNGYDAYSILKTGRDHHGNFMPIAVEAYGDYRPPLFDYSLIPLIGAFGLKPSVVRLGAAMWGIADLGAAVGIAGLIAGWPAAAAAAVLGALSPWQVAFSRFGQEAITGSATVTLAMLSFFQWLRRRKRGWLIASAVLFGLSLYSYSIAKLFTPLMLGLLTALYWRELRLQWREAIVASAAIVVIATPLAVITIRHPVEMQGRYKQMSLSHYMATCPGCAPAAALAASDSTLARVENFAANWAGYFSPAFLFVSGDRGDHWSLLHPQGFGQLLPEQAVLIVLGLGALLSARRRRSVVVLLAWLVIAAIPAAMTVPTGVLLPEPGVNPPTPFALMPAVPIADVPLTPALLYAHPESRRGTLAMTPWTVLSAVGLVVLIELPASSAVLTAVAVIVLAATTLLSGARFVRSYFRDYPVQAAPYFEYGMQQAIGATQKAGGDHAPVFITNKVMMPYIYVLFFERYPPEQFQREPVQYEHGEPGTRLYAGVAGFDCFMFRDPRFPYMVMPEGVFVFPGGEQQPGTPFAEIRYPDGSVAYRVMVKARATAAPRD